MRYAEKSFEIRFCAALSAAIMPFNRNPQWFGMTQAQERITGIDTMIKIGGRLTLFQFKAKQDQKFKLDKPQWRNLDRIARRYPDSVHYVFPEASNANEAADHNCVLNHSWCCSTAALGPSFSKMANSCSLELTPSASALKKSRPKNSIPAKTACQTFGCYCPPRWNAVMVANTADAETLAFFLRQTLPEADTDQALPPFRPARFGIPMGPQDPSDPNSSSISSSEHFEDLLGDAARQNLSAGLFGLFIH